MAVTINASTSAGLVQTADTSGVLQLQTNSGTTALTIDTSQRAAFVAGTAAAPAITTTGDTNTGIWFPAADTIAFAEGGAESMRIDSSGNVLVGTTSTILSNTKFNLSSSQAAGLGGMGFVNTGASTKKWQIGSDANGNFVVFNDSTVGAYIAYGGTSWIANSDERKKDIIEPITNAVNKVSTLRAVIGKYKTDEENTRRTFLIAQDVQAVLPEAVEATNPDNLGVKYTEVIPLLVAAIKEQSVTINDLKARITALEGAA
jgi:hypothetical protein